MARMTLDTTDTRAQARNALIAATAAYDRALQAVEDARLAQHARIVEARLDGVRQVDITGLTRTKTRDRGFTREHIRRIEKAHRRRLLRAQELGLDVAAMSTEEILQIVLPGEENRPVRVDPVLDDVTDDDADDDDDDADDDEDDDADEAMPAGVVA